MTVRGENDFVDERGVTAEFLESFSGLKAVYPMKFIRGCYNIILYLLLKYISKCNSFYYLIVVSNEVDNI